MDDIVVYCGTQNWVIEGSGLVVDHEWQPFPFWQYA